MVHAAGGLVYLDGANMNAIMGIARPGDFGADMMHFNPHKTFSGPHGGGGPGAGPIAVSRPAGALSARAAGGPQRRTDIAWRRPAAVDRPRAELFRQYGRAGPHVLLPAHARARQGLRRVAENAVLNANYLLAPREAHSCRVPQGDRCMHEFVASAARLKAERGMAAMDIAKRLLDYGFHAPTVYFPLIVARP